MTEGACWGREDLLSAYLDGELGPGDLAEVVAHLESCTDCQTTFRAVKEARAAVRMLPTLEVPGIAFAGDHLGDSLSAYLDGELNAPDVARVTRHLGECRACRDQLQEVDAARTAIRALPRLDVSVGVGDAAAAAPSHRLRRPIAVAVAAALAATLGISMARSDPVVPLDLDNLATRHNARVSVESSFAVIPASNTTGSTP